MQRIMIIGGPGSGKSWLAKELSSVFELPVIAVDDLVWDAQGQLRADADIDAHARAAALQDRWIIEGGNSRTYGERAARADMIVRLRPAIWRRLWRVMRRGCPSFSLLMWTWRYDQVFGPRDAAAMASAPSGRMTRTLSVPGEIRAFVADMAREHSG